jgi:hypothetical protein
MEAAVKSKRKVNKTSEFFPELDKYLRKNKALTKFKRNIKNSVRNGEGGGCFRKHNSVKERVEYINSKPDVEFAIYSAFIYRNTPEGYEYWTKLDEDGFNINNSKFK